MGGLDQQNQMSLKKDLHSSLNNQDMNNSLNNTDNNNSLSNHATNAESRSSNGTKRAWGNGVDIYYRDSIGPHPHSINNIPEPVIETQEAPVVENGGVFHYAQKALKQLKDLKNNLFAPTAEPVESKEPKAETNNDHLANSIGDKLEGIILQAEQEYEQTKDPLTKTIIYITEKLETELKKETIDWNKMDLLIRQLAILLLQKMANNDNKTIQEELEMMRKDVSNIRETYNTGWELGIGIAMGAVSMIGGIAGITGGAAGLLGPAAKGFASSMSAVANGLGTISQGVGQPAQKYVSSVAESERQLRQYELERDRTYKQTVESSMQGTKSLKGGQMSQRDRAIEQAHRALLQVLSASAG